MNNKIIKIKAGVDINSPTLKTYCQKLKENKIHSSYLDDAVKDASIALTNPIVFKDEDYNEYSVDDISFVWVEDEIIGHQVITMEKKKSTVFLGHNSGNKLDPNYLNNPSYRRRTTRLEYYSEVELDYSIFQKYYEERKNGKLESEIDLEYEKSFTVKK